MRPGLPYVQAWHLGCCFEDRSLDINPVFSCVVSLAPETDLKALFSLGCKGKDEYADVGQTEVALRSISAVSVTFLFITDNTSFLYPKV